MANCLLKRSGFSKVKIDFLGERTNKYERLGNFDITMDLSEYRMLLVGTVRYDNEVNNLCIGPVLKGVTCNCPNTDGYRNCIFSDSKISFTGYTQTYFAIPDKIWGMKI